MTSETEKWLRAANPLRSKCTFLVMFLVGLFALLAPPRALASDTMVTFDVTGTFIPPLTGGPQYASGSTITIDTTAGAITNASLSIPGEGVSFSGVPFFLSTLDTYLWIDSDTLAITGLPNLVGFNGGSVLSTLFVTGQFTPFAGGFSQLDPTPEPSTLLLFGTGLLAIAGFLCKRSWSSRQ